MRRKMQKQVRAQRVLNKKEEKNENILFIDNKKAYHLYKKAEVELRLTAHNNRRLWKCVKETDKNLIISEKKKLKTKA